MSDCIGCGLTKEYREQLRERAEKCAAYFAPISCCDVLVLLRQVDALEKEADWLARVCAEQMLEGVDEQSVQWWRKKARGAAGASHD